MPGKGFARLRLDWSSLRHVQGWQRCLTQGGALERSRFSVAPKKDQREFAAAAAALTRASRERATRVLVTAAYLAIPSFSHARLPPTKALWISSRSRQPPAAPSFLSVWAVQSTCLLACSSQKWASAAPPDHLGRRAAAGRMPGRGRCRRLHQTQLRSLALAGQATCGVGGLLVLGRGDLSHGIFLDEC